MRSSVLIALSAALASAPSAYAAPIVATSAGEAKTEPYNYHNLIIDGPEVVGVVAHKRAPALTAGQYLYHGKVMDAPKVVSKRGYSDRGNPQTFSSSSSSTLKPDQAIPSIINKMVNSVLKMTSDDPTTQTIISVAQGAIYGAGGVLLAADWWKKNVTPLAQQIMGKPSSGPTLAQALKGINQSGLVATTGPYSSGNAIPRPMKPPGRISAVKPVYMSDVKAAKPVTFFNDVDVNAAADEEVLGEIEEGSISEFQQEVGKEYIYAVATQMNTAQRDALRQQFLIAKQNGAISSAEWKQLTAVISVAPAPVKAVAAASRYEDLD